MIPCAGWGRLSADSVPCQVPRSAQGGRKVRVSWRSTRLLAALPYPLLFTPTGNSFCWRLVCCQERSERRCACRDTAQPQLALATKNYSGKFNPQIYPASMKTVRQEMDFGNAVVSIEANKTSFFFFFFYGPSEARSMNVML